MRIATLDFEASALDGWPIEAGWMREGDAAPKSMLIRPDASFHVTEWSSVAEAVHKITRERLDHEGIEAHAVLVAMSADLQDCRVVSDAPDYDAAWLGRLCTVADAAPPFSLCSIAEVLPWLAARSGLSIEEAVRRYVAASATAPPPAHRA